MQAIAQLSYIVSGDPDPAEYHLPLAKLLCGRRPDSEYRLTRPLTPEQRRECEDLLTAVLDHAVLRDATIDGLRAALLRRPATLGVRDHARLLRVERRPHDRILAQLPWSWSWVKLPWMCEPLQVEW